MTTFNTEQEEAFLDVVSRKNPHYETIQKLESEISERRMKIAQLKTEDEKNVGLLVAISRIEEREEQVKAMSNQVLCENLVEFVWADYGMGSIQDALISEALERLGYARPDLDVE
jgi:hypothetical protein